MTREELAAKVVEYPKTEVPDIQEDIKKRIQLLEKEFNMLGADGYRMVDLIENRANLMKLSGVPGYSLMSREVIEACITREYPNVYEYFNEHNCKTAVFIDADGDIQIVRKTADGFDYLYIVNDPDPFDEDFEWAEEYEAEEWYYTDAADNESHIKDLLTKLNKSNLKYINKFLKYKV